MIISANDIYFITQSHKNSHQLIKMFLRTMATASPPPPSTSQSSQQLPPSSPSQLPLRKMPGSYGWPLVGPLSDRLDYFWFQGQEKFFKTRVEKYKSTVFRTNIPPTFPFFSGAVNPNIVAVLDVKSFSHLFDMDLVDKRDVLIGDFRPSLDFYGGVRVGVYLDTTEPKHSKVKNFATAILKRGSEVWRQELLSNLDTFWKTVESDISQNDAASYVFPLQSCVFNFLTASLTGVKTSVSPEIAEGGWKMLNTWLALQVIPTTSIGLFPPLEELLLHSWAYPSFIAAGGYKKLYDFINDNAVEVIRLGQEEFGLTRDETIHNLLFVLGFNAYGGFSVFLPSLIGRIAGDDSGLQERLRSEVREVYGSGSGSGLTFRMVNDMELVKSVVYETLRLNPPVPLQFARARKDFQISSHDAVYEVNKGELLCGYQPLVMRDANVFDEPEIFKPDRYIGQSGSDLLNYLFWSNGPQTGTPSESNKQCAAKDMVTLTACMIIADLYLRYDKITGDGGSIKAVEKAK